MELVISVRGRFPELVLIYCGAVTCEVDSETCCLVCVCKGLDALCGGRGTEPLPGVLVALDTVLDEAVDRERCRIVVGEELEEVVLVLLVCRILQAPVCAV